MLAIIFKKNHLFQLFYWTLWKYWMCSSWDSSWETIEIYIHTQNLINSLFTLTQPKLTIIIHVSKYMKYIKFNRVPTNFEFINSLGGKVYLPELKLSEQFSYSIMYQIFKKPNSFFQQRLHQFITCTKSEQIEIVRIWLQFIQIAIDDNKNSFNGSSLDIWPHSSKTDFWWRGVYM